MKRIKKYEFVRMCGIWIMCCFLSVFQGFAQTKTVTGTVTDRQTGEELVGVSLMIVGSTKGTVTDADGRFSLPEVPSGAVLTVSYIGYVTQRVAVGNQSEIYIRMEEDVAALDEVVVVGYGTQKKATLTGSVVAVNNEQIVTTKNSNVQNMLTGKLPGLRVIQKTSEPGQFTNQFDIRGLGNPLFVVDGVARPELSRMDPNDIESISILKDASAAIYGMRAANGVVLITTKNGEKGKAKIEYTGYYGIQMQADWMKTANARDRAILANELTMRSTSNPTKEYDNTYFERLKNGELPDSDWYSAVLNETAPQQQHNISINGGSEKVDYYVNFGYNEQNSFYTTNAARYNRYNLRSNLNARITDNLKASVKLNLIMDDTYRQRLITESVFKMLWRSRPNDPIYANNTRPYYFHPDTEFNVLPTVDPDVSGYVLNSKNMLQSNMQLDYDVPHIPGLTASAMFSYDKTYDDNTDYRKEYGEYTYNEVAQTYVKTTRNSPNLLTRAYLTNYATLWNARLNYDRAFADTHHVNALLLYEEIYNQGYDFSASRYLDIAIPYLFAGNDEGQVGSGSGLSEYASRSLAGRFNYDYRGKYIGEFSFRYDGSSRFPKGKQWGFFPSVLLAYRISEEAFIRDSFSFINNLKLRGSWGQLGDDNASTFQFVEGYDYPAARGNITLNNGYVFGSTFVNALGFRDAPNPYITWYTATMRNLGLDLDVWKGLFGFSLDLFRRDRDGLLDTPEIIVPGTFGSGISQTNMNADRTKGFEVEVRHQYHVNRDFGYRVTGFVSMARNMATTIVQPERLNSYDYWRWNKENRYNDIWFGKGAAGTYQTYDEIASSIYASASTLPGDPIYLDWNGDGVIDDDDDHPIATTINSEKEAQDQRNYPLMNFGLTLGAQYKWFDLTVQMQGSAMGYVSYDEQLYSPLWGGGNALPIMFDRWHPADPDADPYNPSTAWASGRFPYGWMRADLNSEFNIQNGAYARLKNMELGFTLPKNIVTNKLGVDQLRLFVNTYNLFTITKVEGLDPERPTENYGYMYPLNRTVNFGGTIGF